MVHGLSGELIRHAVKTREIPGDGEKSAHGPSLALADGQRLFSAGGSSRRQTLATNDRPSLGNTRVMIHVRLSSLIGFQDQLWLRAAVRRTLPCLGSLWPDLSPQAAGRPAATVVHEAFTA
jgi:hypothetical protein